MAETRPIHERRHPEWLRFRDHWRWMLDSLEGGEVYRDAIYGTDADGFPIRNLIRHKHETPSPWEVRTANQSAVGVISGIRLETQLALSFLTGDGDSKHADTINSTYEFRRARTPVPAFVREAVDGHLAEIYSHEVSRNGPAKVREWWADVDGQGTTLDDFMEATVAPLLLTLGQIDLLLDRPAVPPGEEVRTRADQERLGLDRCVVSVVLPQNLLWWRRDPSGGRYAEVLIQEFREDENGDLHPLLRHWTESDWTLYDPKTGETIDSRPHPYGVVPVVRVFDRVRPRQRNVGMSRYEEIAQLQMEYYNKDSELTLSDSMGSHPTVQAPEEFCDDKGNVMVGPGHVLLKKRVDNGIGPPTYEGYDYLSPPQDGAASIRLNKADIRQQVDRSSRLSNPAGQSGAVKSTVEQSGISKAIDQKSANRQLKQIAATLRRCEEGISRMAAKILGVPDKATPRLQISYPSNFELYSVSDVSIASSDFQAILAKAGACPEAEIPILQRQYRLVMPDRTDEFYAKVDRALEQTINEAATAKKQQQELMLASQKQAASDNRLDPAGNVRKDVKNPADRLQPPGQTGQKSAQDAAKS